MEEDSNLVCKIWIYNFDKHNPNVHTRKKGLLLLFNATVSKKNKELFKVKLDCDCTLACIYHKYRKRYTDLRKLEFLTKAKKVTITSDKIWLEKGSLLCGEKSIVRARSNFSRVEKLELRDRVLSIAEHSRYSFLSLLYHRIVNCYDLVNVEAFIIKSVEVFITWT